MQYQDRLWVSTMPKKQHNKPCSDKKAEGIFIWTENKQPEDVSMLPEGIYEQMIVYIFLSFWIVGP